MLRAVYWGQLQEMQDRLLLLTSMVSFALRQSMVILRKRDYQQAQWLIDNDRSINATRYGIEQDCLALIATQRVSWKLPGNSNASGTTPRGSAGSSCDCRRKSYLPCPMAKSRSCARR
jgi:hypothetical protein